MTIDEDLLYKAISELKDDLKQLHDKVDGIDNKIEDLKWNIGHDPQGKNKE